MRDFVEIETGNQARRRGEEFLSHQEIAACVDPKLQNAEAGERPAVAFLDTSDTVELSSLVILEDDSAREDDFTEDPWTRVATTRIDVFDPKKIGQIDERLLEAALDFLPLEARLREEDISWGGLGILDRIKTLPVDFGD